MSWPLDLHISLHKEEEFAYGRWIIKLEGDIAAIVFLQTPNSTTRHQYGGGIVKQMDDTIEVSANI